MGARRRIGSLAVAVATVAGAAACGADGSAAPTTTAEPPATVVEGPLAVAEILPGDCLGGIVIGATERIELQTADLVSCERAHGLEVFATFRLVATDLGVDSLEEFPGLARVVRTADERCLARADATGIERERFGLIAFWPTRRSWEGGDRTVACAIYDANGGLFSTRQLG